MLLRKKVSSVFLAAIVSSLIIAPAPALAQTKEEILAAYRAYVEAEEAGNHRKAKAYAKSAYEMALAAWGDSDRQTGSLAANYGYALEKLGEWTEAAAVFDNCAELLAAFPESLSTRVECVYMSGRVRQRGGKIEKSREKYLRAIELAGDSKDPKIIKSVGDCYLGLAGAVEGPATPALPPRSTIGSGETSSRLAGRSAEFDPPTDKIEDYAALAIENYEKAGATETTDYALALRILGNVAEMREEFERAQGLYQSAADILAKILSENDPLTVQMRGRQKLAELDAYATRSEAGGPVPSRPPSRADCRIGFSDGVEMELCVELRIKPYFPNSEIYKKSEGFVLIRYDVTEKGVVENASVVLDWPGGVFTERSLKSVAKWKYFPPVDMQGNVRRFNGAESLIKFEIK